MDELDRLRRPVEPEVRFADRADVVFRGPCGPGHFEAAGLRSGGPGCPDRVARKLSDVERYQPYRSVGMCAG